MRRPRRWMWAAAVLVASGCAGTGLTPSPQLTSLGEGQREIRRELSELRAEHTQAARRAVDAEADIRLALEDLEARFDRLEAQLRDLLDGLRRPEGVPVGRSPVSAGGGEVQAPATDHRTAYEAAYLEVTRGHYELAVSMLEEFLRAWPGTDLSDNAVYWIGECYYVQRDFNRAAEAFVRLMDSYPDGDKVPAAMLKLGFAFEELGDRPASQRYLRALIDKHPGSGEAEKARERLGSAGSATPAGD